MSSRETYHHYNMKTKEAQIQFLSVGPEEGTTWVWGLIAKKKYVEDI